MKIMQVIHSFWTGGAEVMCEELIYRLKAMGEEVIVVSLYDHKTTIATRMEERGVKIIYLDKKPGIDLSIIRKLRKYIDELKPDVIHTHLDSVIYTVFASKKTKIVHTVHNVAEKESNKKIRFILKHFIKKGKLRLVALSDLIKESILNLYKIKNLNVPVVLNGIDLSKCITKTDYQLCGNECTYIHVGRFALQKNHELLINAFNDVHTKYKNTKLVLVGEGNLQDNIKMLVKEKGLDECVEFKGVLPSASEEMNKADIFVLSSFYEGIPIVLMEAMGTGLPIITTAVGGVPDMLDNQTAILIPVDQTALVSSMELLYNNSVLRKKLGEAAKEKSYYFSSDIMAKKYIEVYKDLV